MILDTLKFIYNHPFNDDNKLGAIARFIKWQIGTRLNPYPVVYPYTEHTRFLIWKGLSGATGNLYCGLLEFGDMAFLLHVLRPDDAFVDIGANVGAYTILAAGEIGAKTTAIEPIPSTFQHLTGNIRINNIGDKVNALNIGLGKERSVIKFTRSHDTVNHVATANETDTVDVQVDKLDNVIDKVPFVIKIDVEGFETEVLNGANRTLENGDLKAIIIELNGSGERYGYDEQLIHAKLLGFGFKPFEYDPMKRQLISLTTYGMHNTIYIRDVEQVQNRLATARKIRIRHREI
ncbi:FkbM family methyltransferase [Paraflavitalea pollutisoli]|uniref:FkbM family methyltransferase n=1 Tax=Paraflavitalea pollutisoli TaxID=3034143 RepID=UPI0023EDD649|nr:FkbM family methyltransferase [Paraflavitalea sp. H1-2-19X]